ncbi:F-box DNA helicase 1 [Epinephelus fuscoguttatus]|uniref:F-box DNA helicase 1 n=1 Tax=Epinephelus fuscoguttatus TaxID=293821 RepID=UPI0020D1AD23|nr:F-box DNA helicase 1 [Epinephelus fuscoguttatus]
MEMAVKGKAKRRHLTAEECDDLGQHAEGANALTQPLIVNHVQGNRDPNRGLYPRTPTKRRKCASVPGSPAGQQRGINNFFSVTGVISSSPHKSSQTCSSTCTNRLNEELFPSEGPKDVKLDEEDDDVSLLAAVLAAEPEAEEDEVDDMSLLAAEMLSQPETKKEEVVDHLEGLTAEMFGDDDEFDQCDILNEEEEVEALPDSYYGLLGSSKALLVPQGCMDDLPEEVLRQILCLVPAQDLYRSVSRVCHHWRNIVEDTKFVPYKKQYFRYMMREKVTMLEILSILENSSIMDPASSQHSIRYLVALMAQHKVGERVRPDDVLECVKKHRLFPQAEASIRLCIPDIQKYHNLGNEGPNPYAAMAVILILSENVGDVQSLVSLLTGCMSHTGITEYLSHMAMMLLALKRSNIKISNRLHYNIYYVLNLMESGAFPVDSSQSGRPQIQLTREQQHILSHNIQEDHVVKIVAFAGTGKTTTLVKYAEQWPHLRFLYVAFNKSVALEAQRRFPRNVSCKTIHSMAFREVGIRYHQRKKLISNLKPFAISSVLPEGHGGFAKAKIVTTTLNTFMASTDTTINITHVPWSRKSKDGLREIIDDSERAVFVLDAQMIWNKMKDLNVTKEEGFNMVHDGYLKLWQLQEPKPCLSHQYDVLLIDEAQDCTPAIMDILLSQDCGKILVGDPHQQIYTFRGAVNALNLVGHTHIYYLTQSFRFGAEIAYVGATILKVCKGVEKILVGGKQKGGVCDETAERIRAAMMTGVSLGRGKMAILSRCNLGVFSEAVRLTDCNASCRIHFIGGVYGYGLSRILDIWQLMEGGGNPRFIKDPLIRFFARKKHESPYWAFKKYLTQTGDAELEGKLSIVEKYGKRIPELVKRLESSFEQDLHRADFIVGTVHKAKGLEFDAVMITDDFAKVPASKHNLHFNPEFRFGDVSDDEWNLLYVAVTRARTSLIITKTVRRILTVAGEYFLKSEMPSTLLKDRIALPCCVKDCPNCTTPGSAFIMCKQTMKCSDGVSVGGPLCERCVWTRIGPTAFLMTDEVLSMAPVPRRLQQVHHMMLLGLF